MARRKVGVWLIGCKGGVAATVTVGLTALRKGLAPTIGLLTEMAPYNELDLVGWGDIVIGGHDIREVSLYDAAQLLATNNRAIDPALVDRCKSDLDKIDKNTRSGTLFNVGSTIEKFADATTKSKSKAESPRDAISRIQADLSEFAKKNALDQVIVVNVASTEPPLSADEVPATWKELSKLLDKPRKCPLPASSLYAIAAIELGFPYVNFTPSPGSALPAIQELAMEKGVPHMGHDGKTGETLLKSALAPMFAARNLQVMSWVGHNIFGNMDGKVLDDPANKATKVRSKDKLLGQILGYSPQTLVSIEYIESLGDWKTAWDHIHFRGFLGTPMTMQFTWQGCDSLLAAPLVIDLIRLTELAARKGEKGLLTFLSCFFKSPLGTTENDFVRQLQMLEAWTAKQK